MQPALQDAGDISYLGAGRGALGAGGGAGGRCRVWTWDTWCGPGVRARAGHVTTAREDHSSRGAAAPGGMGRA